MKQQMLAKSPATLYSEGRVIFRTSLAYIVCVASQQAQVSGAIQAWKMLSD